MRSNPSLVTVLAEAKAIRKSGDQLAEAMNQIADAITHLAVDLACR